MEPVIHRRGGVGTRRFLYACRSSISRDKYSNELARPQLACERASVIYSLGDHPTAERERRQTRRPVHGCRLSFAVAIGEAGNDISGKGIAGMGMRWAREFYRPFVPIPLPLIPLPIPFSSWHVPFSQAGTSFVEGPGPVTGVGLVVRRNFRTAVHDQCTFHDIDFGIVHHDRPASWPYRFIVKSRASQFRRQFPPIHSRDFRDDCLSRKHRCVGWVRGVRFVYFDDYALRRVPRGYLPRWLRPPPRDRDDDGHGDDEEKNDDWFDSDSSHASFFLRTAANRSAAPVEMPVRCLSAQSQIALRPEGHPC